MTGLAQKPKAEWLPYLDDITPSAAWQMLSADAAAGLIDVRTDAEWQAIGLPDLVALNKQTLALSWRLLPDRRVNEYFTDLVSKRFPDKNAPLLFLCKTGGRSAEAAAAMTAQGYTQCYNVINGYEGPADASGQTGRLAGWLAEGLPWGRP